MSAYGLDRGQSWRRRGGGGGRRISNAPQLVRITSGLPIFRQLRSDPSLRSLQRIGDAWRRATSGLHQNDFVANIEQLAVNAVSDLIAKCASLDPLIESNDKTPMTDGHVDIYGDPKHSNATLLGRVPVQVKGRTTNSTKLKPSFLIDRDTLRFFRNSGGGVYFLVQVRKDFGSRVVFFVNLNPFRIDRMLQVQTKPGSVSVAFEKLPEDSAGIEKIFKLALVQQKQGKTEGVDEHLLEGLRGITIHTIDELSSDKPTVLKLADSDFAVTIETEGGLQIPFDTDLTVFPASFAPREIDTVVQCGAVKYLSPTVWQSENKVVNFRLSDGLHIRARNIDGELSASIDLVPQGSLHSQLRALDFFLAAAHGEHLAIGDIRSDPESHTFAHALEVTEMRERIGRIVELFDAIGADEEMIGSVDWSDDDKHMLLALHDAFVLGRDVAATSDGLGHLGIPVGPFKIVAFVMSGATPGRLRVVNPFDPTKRAEFRLFQPKQGGGVKETINGTVYESLQIADVSSTLNLHLENIVQAYGDIEDQTVALLLANQMVLTLLSAADSVDGVKRKRLLVGAGSLSDWLVENGDDDSVYKINYWQTRRRLGSLSADDTVEIRTERRSVQRQDGDDARIREACLSILLNDFGDLDAILDDLAEDQLERLHSWPIWALADAR